MVIDRYQPTDRDRGPRDDYYDNSRQVASRDREDRRRAPSPTAANIDRYVPGQDPSKPVLKVNPLASPITLDTQAGFSFFAPCPVSVNCCAIPACELLWIAFACFTCKCELPLPANCRHVICSEGSFTAIPLL